MDVKKIEIHWKDGSVRFLRTGTIEIQGQWAHVTGERDNGAWENIIIPMHSLECLKYDEYPPET